MTVYVDDPIGPYRVGRLYGMWCHLTADTTLELLAFADRLGLKRSWLQQHRGLVNNPHFDLFESRRNRALALGAVYKPMKEQIRERLKGTSTGLT